MVQHSITTKPGYNRPMTAPGHTILPDPSTLSARHLEKALEQCRKHSFDLFNKGVSGHCDSIALALMDVLTAHGIACQLQVVERTRQSADDGRVIDSNPMSHVILKALNDQWDIMGSNAMQNWFDGWIQPEDEDEDVPCEDVFDEHNISCEDLADLRSKQDNRKPNEEVRAQAFQAINRSLANIRTSSQIDQDPRLAGSFDYYTKGGCHELAVALHRKYGFDIVIADNDDGLIHAYALDTNEIAWDISGARDMASIKADGDNSMDGSALIERFSNEADFAERYVAAGNFERQQKMPLSAYSPGEIERAGNMAKELFQNHPDFIAAVISRPRAAWKP